MTNQDKDKKKTKKTWKAVGSFVLAVAGAILTGSTIMNQNKQS